MSIFDMSSTSPGTEEGKMGKFQEDMARTLDELARTAGNQTGQGGRLTAAGLRALTEVADIRKGMGLGMAELGTRERINQATTQAHIQGAEIGAAPHMIEATEKWKPIPGTENLLSASSGMPNSARKFGIGNLGDTTTMTNVNQPTSFLSKDVLDSLKIPGFGY